MILIIGSMGERVTASQAEMAAALGLNSRSAWGRVRDHLVDLGVIEVERGSIGMSGEQKTSSFRIRPPFDSLSRPGQEAVKGGQGPVKDLRAPGQGSGQGPGQGETNNPIPLAFEFSPEKKEACEAVAEAFCRALWRTMPEAVLEAITNRDAKPANVHPANARRAENDDWPPPDTAGIKRTLDEWIAVYKASGKDQQRAEKEFGDVRRNCYEFVVRALASYRIKVKREGVEAVPSPCGFVWRLIRDGEPFDEGTSENWDMNDTTLANTKFTGPRSPKGKKKDGPAGDTSWMSRL